MIVGGDEHGVDGCLCSHTVRYGALAKGAGTGRNHYQPRFVMVSLDPSDCGEIEFQLLHALTLLLHMIIGVDGIKSKTCRLALHMQIERPAVDKFLEVLKSNL